jgi:hypothetical protein
MIKKCAATLIAVVSTMVFVGMSSSPADAAGAIQFRKFYYDTPGSDARTNTALNGEWFDLKNVSTTSRNLYGFTVRDNSSHVYRFGSTFYLRPGYTVRIHTGKGTNTSTNRYWGQSWYIWNNTGDKATLKNREGTVLDTCSWSSRGVGYKSC